MEQIRVSTFAGPGAQPVIHTVPRPKISSNAALIKVGACGVCGTDLHILKGRWPKQLPWPFTLGHELGGVLVEVGNEFKTDFMEKPLAVGSKVMIPPLMPCGRCYYCIHYPQSANKCLTPGLLRPIPRVPQAAASVRRMGGIRLCGSRHVAWHENLQIAG
jgi:D-arabinose 1-dehydrogenase-like Zn-dependent alcohol dehydrogenase